MARAVRWMTRSWNIRPAISPNRDSNWGSRAYASGPLLVEKLVDELERKEKLLEQIRALLKAHA